MKSPSKLVSRIQSTFVRIQLAIMLEKSIKLEMILDMPYYDYDFSTLGVEINVDNDDEALKKISRS